MRSFHPHVDIHTELDADLKPILGSFLHLSKMVMNLVSNAAEALPEGGELFITTKNDAFRSTAQGGDSVSIDECIMLRIRDTGIGISDRDVERIFEPFYTKKKMWRSGTGLGMAMAWETVQDHQGNIDVDNAPGAGTTVTVRIPVTRQTPAPIRSESRRETFQGRGRPY